MSEVYSNPQNFGHTFTPFFFTISTIKICLLSLFFYFWKVHKFHAFSFDFLSGAIEFYLLAEKIGFAYHFWKRRFFIWKSAFSKFLIGWCRSISFSSLFHFFSSDSKLVMQISMIFIPPLFNLNIIISFIFYLFTVIYDKLFVWSI